MNILFIYSKILTEFLLRSRHSSRCYKYDNEQNRLFKNVKKCLWILCNLTEVSRQWRNIKVKYRHVPLNDEICSEKCLVRQFPHCVNIVECTYTSLGGIAYSIPRLCYNLLLLCYKPAKHASVLNYNTMVKYLCI